MPYTLSKSERLCSKKLMEQLLASKLSFVKYPFRVVYTLSALPGEYPARIAVSVGKKRFKRAVKRNRIKRLAREAFRLHKDELYDRLPAGTTVDMLLIYLDSALPTYAKTEKAVRAVLCKIADQLTAAKDPA